MIPNLNGFDLIIILVIALLVFGPKKLPEMGAAVGKSIKEFQKGMKELTSPKEKEEKDDISQLTKKNVSATTVQDEKEAPVSAVQDEKAASPTTAQATSQQNEK